MIRVERVRKVFGRGDRAVVALDGLSLAVPRGQFVAVVGPSGSGKSTLLHLIAGLDTPTEGAIAIDGRSMAAMTDDELTIFRRRHVGVVFQVYNLLPTLTAEENVALPLVLDGRPRDEVRERVARALAMSGLAHRGRHLPGELSGGETQRVAIARALVVEPLVLLADEPTGNLDSRTRGEILDWIRGTAARLGQTVVMVTHDHESAAYADRIVALADGRVVDGAPAGSARRHDLAPGRGQ